MPGNEVGDRVHNFFAQENISQGQHSQVVDGNWPLNDNLWVNSQRQFGVPSSNPKNYNPQQSDFERGHGSQHVPLPQTFDFTETTARPKFAKSQFQNQQPNMNGYMYGRQIYETRPEEANFLGVATESDQNNVNQRGFSLYESQQDGVSEQISKNSIRSDTSDAHGSFDLFGGQHQMNSQYPGLPQPLQQQQSGFHDIQQLQQQFMFRKMQELQRQEDLRQLEARKQSSVNEVSPFARQASGTHGHGFMNGTPTSDSSSYPWGELTAGNKNWLQRASMQGSSSGHVFSPEQGQLQHSMGVVHQQVDQSLYGVPISGSRGPLNQYPHVARDKSLVHQLPTYSNSFSGAQYAVSPEQLTMQDGSSVGRQGLPGKSLFGPASGQGLNGGIKMDHIQQLKDMPRNASMREIQGPQDLFGPSEIVQDKPETEATSSHGAASLDPDEEKILFGSDDNIWDAFGSNRNMDGGTSNLLDSDEFANGLPSIQSGSWSALMQSAVAETTSSGIGLQDEWAGPNFQNPEIPSTRRSSANGDSGKQQTALGDVNLHNTSELSFGSVPLADGGNMSDKRHGKMGFQHHGKKNLYEHDERPDINNSIEIKQPSSGGGSWLNRGAVQKVDVDESRLYENDSNSLGGEMSTKSISGHWTSQQYGTSQPNSKQNIWIETESVPPPGYNRININESNNSLQQSQTGDRKRLMLDRLGQGDGMFKVNSLLRSNVESEPVKTSMFNQQINREGFYVNSTDAVPNLSNLQGGNRSSHILPSNHQLNHWKHIDSSMKSGSENSGKSQRRMNKGPQVSESSFNSSDKEDLKMHEMGSSSKRENSNDNYRPTSSHLASTVGLRENFSLDAAGDSRSLPGTKQSLSNQAGQMTSGQRKFQYHPMGNLDEDIEIPYRTLQHSGGLRGQDQGNFGRTTISAQGPQNSAEVGKGLVLELEGVPKGSDMQFKGMIPGHVPNMFAPYDKSIGLSTSDKGSQPSQNMLELLHKVDQSRDHGIARHLNSFERNSSSEVAEPENSDGSFGGLQRSQSSNSQGIGLQLGPPSQRLPFPNHASPRAMQASLSQAQISSKLRGKGHAELSPFQETSRGEFMNDRIAVLGKASNETSVNKMIANFSSALGTDFSNSRSQFPNHQIIGAKGQALTNLSGNESYDRHAPQIRQNEETSSRPLSGQPVEGGLPNVAGRGLYDNAASSHERVQASQSSSGEKLPASLPRSNSGMAQQGTFSKMLPNAWTNLSNQQLLATQARKSHSNLSQSQQLNIVESNSLGCQNLEEQEAEKRGNILSEFGTGSLNSQRSASVGEQSAKESQKTNGSSGKVDRAQTMNGPPSMDSIIKPFSDASSVNPTATQRDLEAFGRSLKPNNFHQNYSLLTQMKAMKSTDSDPSNRNELDTSLNDQQIVPWSGQSTEHDSMVGDVLTCRTADPHGDTQMLTFSGSIDKVEQNVASQAGSVPSKDVCAFGQTESQSYIHGNSVTSVKFEPSHISSNMAPSWFDQYGTPKNGQMLSRRVDTVKTMEQPFSIGRVSSSMETHNSKEQVSAVSDTGQAGVIWTNPVPPSLAIEQFSSPPLPTNTSVQKLVTLRPKKRKHAIADLHSWFREVSGDFKNLQDICTTAVEWSRAANRLMEKVEDDGEVIEDARPMPKPKRRIILTTQLMQQLLRPPPAAILFTDAITNYESVAFYMTRLALGDACNLVSSVRNSSSVPHTGANSLYDKSNKPEKVDHRLSEVTEDYMNKARKLENDFLRLDKRASILDLRVECQDVEKFSFINRFARFHGSAESWSSDAAASALKPSPQRYVTAFPLPNNLPDRVQCLSL